MLPDQIKIMRNDHDRALFMVPVLDQPDKISNRLLIHRIEWLIEQDQIGILDKHTRKQCALELSTRKTVE
ncbi:hypothetical protein D9M72_625940 [compost metagenome]